MLCIGWAIVSQMALRFLTLAAMEAVGQIHLETHWIVFFMNPAREI